MQTLSKHFILCCSILFCTASVKGQWQELDVPPIGQESRDWCWAACMEMVLDYHGHTETQINLVSQYLILDGATSTPTLSTYCDGSSPSAADHTLTYTNRNSSNFFPQYADLLFNSKRFFSVQSPYTNAILWSDVQAEINACQPFVLFLNRGDSIGIMDRSILDSEFEHGVVVKGTYQHTTKSTKEDYMIANDPYNIPRCTGCTVLLPKRILDDPVTYPYSALHSIRHIFPMSRDTCDHCEDKEILSTSPFFTAVSSVQNKNLLDNVFNGAMASSVYSSLSFLGFQESPPIEYQSYDLATGSAQNIYLNVITSSDLAYYFFQDATSGKYLLRRVVDRNCTPFNSPVLLFVPVGGESEVEFPIGTYSITEFLPSGEQYYRVEYKGQTYLSPLYTYGKLGFKPGIIYPESQIAKIYRREARQERKEYKRSLRDLFKNLRE